MNYRNIILSTLVVISAGYAPATLAMQQVPVPREVTYATTGQADNLRYLLDNWPTFNLNFMYMIDGNSRVETLLYIACRLGHFEVVKLLIEKGANIHVVNPQGFGQGLTPLYIACAKGHLNITEFLVKCLVAQGQSINPKITHGPSQGETPLHRACVNGHFNIVEFLVKKFGRTGPKHKP